MPTLLGILLRPEPVCPPARCLQLEGLDALQSCVGWELERAAEDPVSGEAVLRLAGLFRLRLNVSRAGTSLAVEALPGAPAAAGQE